VDPLYVDREQEVERVAFALSQSAIGLADVLLV
jgi:hypothetical protein